MCETLTKIKKVNKRWNQEVQEIERERWNQERE